MPPRPQQRLTRQLDQLAAFRPEDAAAIRQEADDFTRLADQAVDAYTQDRRVIGNSLFAQARQHTLTVEPTAGRLGRDARSPGAGCARCRD